MSLLKRLFGLGGAAAPKEEKAPTLEIGGHVVTATPYQEAGQWQLCGVISKEIDGVRKEHRFVRADRFTDRDTAVDMVFVKARMIVEQMGDEIYG
ncbi:MAG: HlyU family transcriptional regulator [Hyphomicrobiales bacterium]|nr:HlyU family transcriptional regulator [Hyphomicrobiales bacterium]